MVGVAEKPVGVAEGHPSLSSWGGWGFVNFRAAFSAGQEKVSRSAHACRRVRYSC